MFLNISFHICNLVLRREDQSVKHVYGGSAATTPPWPNHQTKAVLQHRNSCEQTHDRLLVTTNVRSNPSIFTGPTQVHLVLTDATTEPKILWSWKCESAAGESHLSAAWRSFPVTCVPADPAVMSRLSLNKLQQETHTAVFYIYSAPTFTTCNWLQQ